MADMLLGRVGAAFLSRSDNVHLLVEIFIDMAGFKPLTLSLLFATYILVVSYFLSPCFLFDKLNILYVLFHFCYWLTSYNSLLF